MKNTSVRVVGPRDPRGSQSNIVYGLVLDCPPKVNSEIIFLKGPHILITGNREIKVELSWKLPLRCSGYWERQPLHRPYSAVNPACWVLLGTVQPTGAIVAWLLWGQSTTSWLDCRPTLREGMYSWYCKPIKLLWLGRS